MKIIEGIRYYTKKEVAEMVNRSPLTIVKWAIWSNELEDRGDKRFIPKPLILDNGYRLWTEEQVDEIRKFAENVRWGDLKEFTRR